jgi:hypothetical protein
MIIDREKDQGGREVAKERVSFCLNQIEGSTHFAKGMSMRDEIVYKLTLEEIIGALVAAEQELEEIQDGT